MSLRERQEIQEVLWRISTGACTLPRPNAWAARIAPWNLQMCSATSRELNFGTLKFSRTSVRESRRPGSKGRRPEG
jgi:hypothetical protein